MSGNIAGFIYDTFGNYYWVFLDLTQLGHRSMIDSCFISYKSGSWDSVFPRVNFVDTADGPSPFWSVRVDDEHQVSYLYVSTISKPLFSS